MRLVAAIVFAVVMVLTGSAHAVPLRITGGQMTSFELGGASDIFYSFGGDGFAADGVVFTDFNDLSGGGNFFSIDAACCGQVTLLMVGALTCSSLDQPQPSGGDCAAEIQLTNTPTPPLDRSPGFDTHSAPFTAIGQLHVGGETFDVVGSGIASATWCSEPLPANANVCAIDRQFPVNQSVQYTFSASVDEPPTLLLVVASLGALGALVSARFLRDRYAARLPAA